jgi:hypothetical protein
MATIWSIRLPAGYESCLDPHNSNEGARFLQHFARWVKFAPRYFVARYGGPLWRFQAPMEAPTSECEPEEAVFTEDRIDDRNDKVH